MSIVVVRAVKNKYRVTICVNYSKTNYLGRTLGVGLGRESEPTGTALATDSLAFARSVVLVLHPENNVKNPMLRIGF
jgi:hypothetical protein